MSSSMTETSLQHLVHTSMAPRKDGGLAAPPSLVNGPHGVRLSSDSGGSSPSPETVSSTGVPNPFAHPHSHPSSPPTPVQSQGMNSINWAQPPSSGPTPPQTQSSLISVPNPFQATKPVSNGVVIASSGIRVSAQSEQPSQHRVASSAPVPAPQRRFNNTGSGGGGGGGSAENKGGLNHRRQKRLERNRESARLSRRRRKQYLEVLEDRVKTLSIEMDTGRRQHVVIAVDTLRDKKRQALADPSALETIESNYASTGSELRVAATFQTQQIRSLSLSPHIKFLLWLSLQNDSYFRGGRAASERLSAARIGERVSVAPNKKPLLFYHLSCSPFSSPRCSPVGMTKSLQRMGCGHYSVTKLVCRMTKKNESAHFRRVC